MKYVSAFFQKYWKSLIYCVIGGALYAFGIRYFAAAANFAPGGVSGLAIICNHLIPSLSLGALVILWNIPISLISYRILGRDYFIKSLFTMACVSFFLDFVWTKFPPYAGDRLMAALFGGIISGFGLSTIYLRGGACAGGTDFIIMSLKRKFPFRSVGTYMTIVDGTIILLGGIVFRDINSILFGILMTAAISMTIDRRMFGAVQSKQLSIITDRGEEVAARIRKEMNRGVTLVQAVGTYSMKSHSMLICLCSPQEVHAIREICFSTDPAAFISISTVDEVFGAGFQPSSDEN